MTQQYADLGSVSCGTVRAEDLIPAFLSALRRLDSERADKLEEVYAEILGDAIDADIELTDEQESQVGWFLNEDLFNTLNEYAPPFCYFGSHPGDGADYGFWFCEESFDDAVHAGEIVKVSDSLGGLDDAPDAEWRSAKYVAVISDHGNVELYSVWDIVNLNPPQSVWAIV